MAKKILITGFLPFDQDPTNPSGDWVNWMVAKSMPHQTKERILRGIVLPVTFQGAFPALKKVCDEFCPDIIVMTGLAKNRKELTVERIGINWVDARIPDNDGVQILSSKIDSEGPDGLFTTVPVEKILDLAKASNTPMKLSTSAGEYVCNDLLYKTLCYTLDKKTSATFIHIPGSDNYDGIYLALESIVNGL
ncbi:pyroglutamyl-peptidase I [Bacteriovorax stolpii]|uniref:Pyrrolidone-carboxylate peptidase n=1 Tax=Bacteriovorax stolpii TaxID=960 RepID=A0A2K9NPV6_BACTC|nr:pyroglutamyl-peptidase I [Bacteriovorax stolpii]AUN97541.1 pyroglutamyl-peptidase I [Bacteriovorax stolpii]QDK42486.1 pyroglutamyl-peptidase I [Bacteriovorax stolpii]TDP52721.1 pyroglutamyl-peptidase I [Bacteriovorax stolpii]